MVCGLTMNVYPHVGGVVRRTSNPVAVRQERGENYKPSYVNSRENELSRTWGAPQVVPARACENQLTKSWRPPLVKSITSDGISRGRDVPSQPFRDVTNVISGGVEKHFGKCKPAKWHAAGELFASSSRLNKYYEGEDPTTLEYACDMIDVYFKTERSSRPRADYMDHQSDLNGKMRAILVDWMAELHKKYKLQRATFFLAVNLVDRFLSSRKVSRAKLQLVGVVGVLVASKFEDILPPPVRHLSYMTDGAFSANDIMDFECSFLSTLQFKLLVTTPAQFLEHFCRVNGCDKRHAELAWYILELSLLEQRMIGRDNALVAAAALFVSNVLLGRSQVWTAEVSAETRLSQGDVKECAGELRAVVDRSSRAALGAVRRKYATAQHFSVSSAVGV